MQVGLDRHYGFTKETGKAAFGDNFRSSGTHGAAVCKWVGGFASRWVGWQGWSGHQQTFGRPVALPLTFPATPIWEHELLMAATPPLNNDFL